MKPGALDLGHGVFATPCVWRPDRTLNPQYADLPDDDLWGITVSHTHDDGTDCRGFVQFDRPTRRILADRGALGAGEIARPTWTVESEDPLTISPSVLQHCGLHGFIRDGRWVPA